MLQLLIGIASAQKFKQVPTKYVLMHKNTKNDFLYTIAPDKVVFPR